MVDIKITISNYNPAATYFVELYKKDSEIALEHKTVEPNTGAIVVFSGKADGSYKARVGMPCGDKLVEWSGFLNTDTGSTVKRCIDLLDFNATYNNLTHSAEITFTQPSDYENISGIHIEAYGEAGLDHEYFFRPEPVFLLPILITKLNPELSRIFFQARYVCSFHSGTSQVETVYGNWSDNRLIKVD